MISGCLIAVLNDFLKCVLYIWNMTSNLHFLFIMYFVHSSPFIHRPELADLTQLIWPSSSSTRIQLLLFAHYAFLTFQFQLQKRNSSLVVLIVHAGKFCVEIWIHSLVYSWAFILFSLSFDIILLNLLRYQNQKVLLFWVLFSCFLDFFP